MFEIGQIIEYKDASWDENFNEAKKWCNRNNAFLEEIVGENGLRRFEIISYPTPTEPSEEELLQRKIIKKRKERNDLLENIHWRIERFEEQTYLGIETNESDEDYKNILSYKQYLRDITKEDDFPNIELKSFEVWLSER